MNGMSEFNISIQPTSNENIIKFVANTFLTQANSFEFKNIEEAAPSPIARQLFHLPFVKTVYISQNFIAVEKFNIVSWKDVQEEVAHSISEYLNSGSPVLEITENSKIPVTVYAESTPNPAAMKFVANKPLADGIFEFKSIDDTEHAPLARELFGFPFVKEVFISSNYVSISKYNMAEWQEISMEIREFIRSYIEKGKPILDDSILNSDTGSNNDGTSKVNSSEENQQKAKTELSATEKEIVAILEEYVKPAVASDGGNIAFDSFNEETKTVRVILQGACSGCPSSTVTLKNGIETMLREMMHGKVNFVEAINA